MNCPVCGSGKNEEGSFRESYWSQEVSKEYFLHHCPECDLKFWTPLEMIREYYENEMQESYARCHRGLQKLLRNTAPFFERVSQGNGKLLDVGCGDGVFMENAQRLGFEVWGNDFDRKSVEAAGKRGLQNVFSMSLEEFSRFCEQRSLKFDVISFFEVLEHQTDPAQFIQTVKKLLKPGGKIVGSVPNRDRFLAAVEKISHKGDFPPHHFTYWSGNVLRYFFKKEGFGNVVILPAALVTFKEVVWWWEEILYFRKCTSGLAAYIKSKVFSEPSQAISRMMSLDELAQRASSGKKFSILKWLNEAKHIPFVPLALLTLNSFNHKDKSKNLYFEGTLLN